MNDGVVRDIANFVHAADAAICRDVAVVIAAKSRENDDGSISEPMNCIAASFEVNLEATDAPQTVPTSWQRGALDALGLKHDTLPRVSVAAQDLFQTRNIKSSSGSSQRSSTKRSRNSKDRTRISAATSSRRGRLPRSKLKRARRPPNAYAIFTKENSTSIRAKHPDLPNLEVFARVAKAWRGLSETEKLTYRRRAIDEAERSEIKLLLSRVVEDAIALYERPNGDVVRY